LLNFRSNRRISAIRSELVSSHRILQASRASIVQVPAASPGEWNPIYWRCHNKIDVKSFGAWMVERKATMEPSFAYRYRLSKLSRLGSGADSLEDGQVSLACRSFNCRPAGFEDALIQNSQFLVDYSHDTLTNRRPAIQMEIADQSS
jgi:hypothetical protein